MMLFLFAGRIVQELTVSLPRGAPADLAGECGITLTPKPHRLIFTPRRESAPEPGRSSSSSV